jgi:hypothetical protein
MGSGQTADLPEPPIFQVRTPDTAAFATLDGLSRITGVSAHYMRPLMCKELADNALDAADAAGRPGQVTIEKHGDSYIVADQGSGIRGRPAELAEMFSIHREMVSTKFQRLPARGALGNGLRVITGCVVVCGGTIAITARGQRVVLRPRPIGPTEIIAADIVPYAPGTRLVVTLGSAIPSAGDEEDLDLAVAAIDFSRCADNVPYARQPSARWMDADAFNVLCMTIEPDTTTVRQVVELFDGLSGAKAGRIATPFGKSRLARSLSDAEASELLAAMQAEAREVKHSALVPIGPDALDRGDYDYSRASGTFTYGTKRPQAEIPYIVEVWVSTTSRKGRSVEIGQTFANRTPIAGDDLGASRSVYFDAKRLTFSGCGMDSATIDDFSLGDFRTHLHIVSPLIPILSIGKRPNLRPFKAAIETALRRAMKLSRDRLPLDMPEPKSPPPPKPSRAPMPEKPVKPPIEIFEPRTPLGKMLAAEAKASGVTPKSLLVLSEGRDPYGLDNARSHEMAEWIGGHVARYRPEHGTSCT